MTGKGKISPFGKVLMVVILGPPALLFAAALVLAPAYYFDLIPCAWDVPLASKLPLGTQVLSCHSRMGVTDSGYDFTAKLSQAEFRTFAVRLGLGPDSSSAWAARSDGPITFSQHTDSEWLDLDWNDGLLTVTYRDL